MTAKGKGKGPLRWPLAAGGAAVRRSEEEKGTRAAVCEGCGGSTAGDAGPVRTYGAVKQSTERLVVHCKRLQTRAGDRHPGCTDEQQGLHARQPIAAVWMETKRLRIQIYTRAARRDGLLHAICPGRSVKETLKGIKKLTSLETLQSLWTTDGFRLDPRGEIWQLVDHDTILIAVDKTTFPVTGTETRKRPAAAAAAATNGDGSGARAPSAKKPRKPSGAAPAKPSPPAATSDGGVSKEYQQFLANEAR